MGTLVFDKCFLLRLGQLIFKSLAISMYMISYKPVYFKLCLCIWFGKNQKFLSLSSMSCFIACVSGNIVTEVCNFGIVSSSNKKVCDMTQQPSSEAKGDDRSEFGEILAEVVGKMRVSVNVLNVTLMGAFRSDAHIGPWTHPSSVFDCSHWCLPGVPDAWNELVFSYLLANGKLSFLDSYY